MELSTNKNLISILIDSLKLIFGKFEIDRFDCC